MTVPARDPAGRATWRGTAQARAGLLGNPGDGYGGKALATLIHDFEATVTLERSRRFVLQPNPGDGLSFGSLGEAIHAFEGGGLEDGLRLVRAAFRRFWILMGTPDLSTDGWAEGLGVRYASTIPRQVGLAGSSAIIIATMRALADRFGVSLDPFELSEAALAAELEDLGIASGPMDRVVQSYRGTLLMDLAPPRGPAGIRRLDTRLLPPLFLAWTPRRTKSSGHLHAPLRERWERRDPEVLAVIQELRDLVDTGVHALEGGDTAAFADAMRRNFDLRSRIFPIHPDDREMVGLAGQHGSSAKLAGSGGAVIGVIGPETDGKELEGAFLARGLAFLRPRLTPPDEHG